MGQSCFPLSVIDNSDLVNENDQLREIMRQIEPLNEEHHLSFIDNKEGRDYISIIQSMGDPESQCHYLTRLGKLPPGMEDLLYNLLQFNPYMRWSAKECMDMPMFAYDLDQY